MDRPLRILHVEDDPADAELIEATLQSGDLRCEMHRVDTRGAFETALRGGGYDLIFSDYTLPSFDGATALAMARDLLPEVPFILVSGTIGEDAAIDSMVGGATDYVLKHRLGRLLPAVRRAMAEAEERRARQQAEHARSASEAKYRRLFETSKDGLLILDGATERILDVNPSLLELLGYSRTAVIGATVGELGLTAHDPACAAAFRELLAREEGHHADLSLKVRGGQTVDVDVVSTRYTVEGQRVIQCSVRDIRERKKLENQLHLAQKLEAVGQLAGGVAHDFNNILVVINSYTEMAVSSLSTSDPLRADLEQVAQAGARAAALTRQLLAFSRRQVLQPRVLSLNTVVAGLEKMLRRLIGEDIELRIVPCEGPWNVRADPAQMEQVLMNLVLNARDAMPQGGALEVATRNVVLGDEEVAGRSDRRPGEYVLLRVADGGCGMDALTLERIFEPFFTTKGPGKGTGLGLATVYGIVSQSGGFIDVQSEVGRGSTFSVYLPRELAQANATEEGQGHLAKGGTETILVVEDDDGIRRLIHRVLEPAGYTVLSASSGQEALELCERRGVPLQLLLTDVVLPAMDGSAVAARVSALRPGVRVLFMSGYFEEAIRHHGGPVSGIDLVHKPFSAQTLLHRIREALDRQPSAGEGASAPGR